MLAYSGCLDGTCTLYMAVLHADDYLTIIAIHELRPVHILELVGMLSLLDSYKRIQHLLSSTSSSEVFNAVG